jgi:HEPN domain-containing protein
VPRKPVPGSAEEWLFRAKSSLALARQPKPTEALWEDQCFLAQQAAEKALKAVYQSRGLLFKFIHDIGELGSGLERGGIRVPPEIRKAIVLTKYAFETRYPGPSEPISKKEYLQALALAGAVVAWAERILRAPKGSGGHPTAHETPTRYRAKRKTARERPRKK